MTNKINKHARFHALLAASKGTITIDGERVIWTLDWRRRLYRRTMVKLFGSDL